MSQAPCPTTAMPCHPHTHSAFGSQPYVALRPWVPARRKKSYRVNHSKSKLRRLRLQAHGSEIAGRGRHIGTSASFSLRSSSHLRLRISAACTAALHASQQTSCTSALPRMTHEGGSTQISQHALIMHRPITPLSCHPSTYSAFWYAGGSVLTRATKKFDIMSVAEHSVGFVLVTSRGTEGYACSVAGS